MSESPNPALALLELGLDPQSHTLQLDDQLSDVERDGPRLGDFAVRLDVGQAEFSRPAMLFRRGLGGGHRAPS